jgi:hypothetical protein
MPAHHEKNLVALGTGLVPGHRNFKGQLSPAMNNQLSKWDSFHILASVMVVAEKRLLDMPMRLFAVCMVMLQVVWFAWLLVGRGRTTALSRAYIGAIRGLTSFSLALMFAFMVGGDHKAMLIICSTLVFAAISVIVMFAVKASEEQAKVAPPGSGKGFIFYADKNDPRVIVPKGEYGVGVTLNFARPESWLFVFLLIGGPLILSIFLKNPN